ncbi:MAG: FecR family protein [Chitinophagaceae bacterium]|nr:MAG: FecR family protein [Chitinophagaceae bacterium]
MIKDNPYSLLLFKYLQGTISDDEHELLMAWVNQSEANKLLFEELTNEESLTKTIKDYHPKNQKKIDEMVYAKISSKILGFKRVIPFYKKRYFTISVAAVLLLMIGLFFMLDISPINKIQPLVAKSAILAPVKTKAMIRLSDHSILNIDSLAVGEIVKIGGVEIVKNADGTIKYQYTSSHAEASSAMNTLSNPKGSKPIDFTLSDGTRVWLNAESEMNFPIAFVGKERKVELSGEAYFEVAHDKQKPFYVQNGQMSVVVLGTRFNVNTYIDQYQYKITLLEGAVKVNYGNEARLLQPNQQANLLKNGAIQVEKDIDVDEVMAWKNGVFKFNQSDIQFVMNLISRWYNVQYEIKEPIHQHFGGTISKEVPLKKVIEMLELTGGVDIKIIGDKLEVYSK